MTKLLSLTMRYVGQACTTTQSAGLRYKGLSSNQAKKEATCIQISVPKFPLLSGPDEKQKNEAHLRMPAPSRFSCSLMMLIPAFSNDAAKSLARLICLSAASSWRP